MRKKVQLSLMALTSVSMAAYADADITNDKVLSGQWTAADGSTITIGNDGTSFTSNTGSDMSLVADLVQGEYKLTANLENAELYVNGVKLGADQTFTVKENGQVTITVKRSGADTVFKASDFNLKLVYDFMPAHDYLLEQLGNATAALDNQDQDNETVKELKNKASDLGAIIKKINVTDGDITAYKVYADYAFYKNGGDGYLDCTLIAEIGDLGKKVESVVGSLNVLKEVDDAYGAANSTLEAATDYAKDKYSTTLEGYKNEIEEFRASDITAKSEEEINNFKTVMVNKLNKLVGDIEESNADDVAYHTVEPKIAEALTKANEAVIAVKTALDKDGETTGSSENIYADWYKLANDKLNEIMGGLQVLHAKNGSSEAHDEAKENQVDCEAAIATALSNIKTIKTEVTENANAQKSQYTINKGYYTDVQKALDEETKLIEGAGLTAKYQSLINAAQSAIDALKNEVEAQNAKHTNTDADSKKLVTSLNTAANEAVRKLVDAAAADIANYKAYTELIAEVDGFQKMFDEAKAYVNGLKSKDGNYVVNGKYTGVEAGVQNQIGAYRAKIEAEYKKGTADGFKNDPSYDNGAANWKADTENQINNYKNNAQAAFDNYEAVVPKVKDYQKKLDELTQKAVNPRVVVSATGKTYAEEIAALQARIDKINNTFKAAQGLKDKAHYNKMMELAADDSFISDAQELIDSYDNDKKSFEEQNMQDAAWTLDEQTKKTLADLEQAINGEKAGNTPESVGNEMDSLNEALDEVLKALDEIKKLNDALGINNKSDITSDNAAEVMANLQEINKEIEEKIKNAFDECIKNDNAAKDRIKAENAAQTAVAGLLDEVKQIIKEAEDADIDKSATFVSNKAALDTKISDLETLILELRAAEKLAAARNEKVDGKTDKGIDEIISDYKNLANDLLQQAKNETYNKEQYDERTKYYGNKGVDVNAAYHAANQAIYDIATGDAKKFYLAEIGKLNDEFKALKDEIGEVYNAFKEKPTWDKDLEADFIAVTNEYKAKIDDLVSRFKALAEDVKANEEAYNGTGTPAEGGLVQESEKLHEYWLEVNAAIVNGDQSSLRDENIEKLRDLQNQLNALDAEAKSDWATGKADDNKEELLKKYAEIFNGIKQIDDWNKDPEGYDKQIATDNYNRYKAFLDAVSGAEALYKEVTGNIGKMTNTSNSIIKKAIDAILDGNQEIYNYSDKFNTLRNKAYNEYKNTRTPDLFDENEGYKGTANTYNADIEAKYKEILDAVYDVAKGQLDKFTGDATDALAAAKKELKENDFTAEVVNRAFADVSEILENATAADLNYADKLNYVVNADEWIEALSHVDELIEAGFEPAAAEEWNIELKPVTEQIEKDLEELQKLVDAGYLAQDAVDTYNAAKAKYYDAAVALAEKSIGAGNLYIDNLNECRKLLEEFKANNGYNSNIEDAANNEAYDIIVKAINELQNTEMAGLVEYANGYYIHGSYDYLIRNAQKLIDELKTEVEGWHAAGEADDKVAADEHKARIDEIKAQIGNIKKNLDAFEANALGADIRNLDILNDDMKDNKAEQNDFDKTLDELTKKLDEVTAKGAGMERHDAYIALEKEVAKVMEALQTQKDENAVADAVAALNEALAAIQAQYTETNSYLNDNCSDNVKDAYAEQLEKLNKELEAIADAITSNQAEQTLLFYNDCIAQDIINAGKALTALDKAIKEAQKPYDEHNAKYTELTDGLDGLKARLAAVKEVINGYREAVNKDKRFVDYLAGIDALVLSAEDELAAYAQAEKDGDLDNMLKSKSEMTVLNDIKARIDCVERNAAVNQYWLEINAEDGLRGMLADAKAVIGANNFKFSDDVQAELDAKYATVSSLIDAVDKYNEAAWRSNWVSTDIDGVNVPDGQKADYMTIAVPAVIERIAKLKEDIKAYAEFIDQNAYVLGDISADGTVGGDDYMTLLAIILEQVDTPEAGSKAAYAADINGDGEYSIADVVALTKMLNGTYTPQNRAAARMAPAVIDDAVVLSAEGEGVNQRIAVRLNNTKAYTGCQMDITLPAGVTFAGVSLGDRAISHDLNSNTLANGNVRIVLSSLDNVAFAEGEDAIVYLDVTVGHIYNGEGIEVSNILFSEANARTYRFADITGNEATGISTVTVGEAIKGKVYSVGGKLMNGMRQGINIIRGNDGSTKKVVVK